MVWTRIKKIEESKINNSTIIYFNYFEKEVCSYVSKKVLNYLKIDSIYDFKEVFVIKTFNKFDKPIYVIKKVK